MTETDVLFSVRNLSVVVRSEAREVRAVDHISYDVRKGESIGIVGESGAGKSLGTLSTLRLIPQPPVELSGEVHFEGKDLLTLSPRELRQVRGKDIGVVFQDPLSSLNPSRTVGAQVAEPLILHGLMDRKAARERSVELLDMVGIPSARSRAKDYPHQFSGGMRQRVGIAIAVACQPRLIIADEPTTALDVTVSAQILDLVVRLREQTGVSLIWVSHDIAVVRQVAERVLVMYGGIIVEDAPVEVALKSPRHPYTSSLLRSCLPSNEPRAEDELYSIPGVAQVLSTTDQGCPFANRCEYAQDICRTQCPPARNVGPGHTTRCWLDDPTADLWGEAPRTGAEAGR